MEVAQIKLNIQHMPLSCVSLYHHVRVFIPLTAYSQQLFNRLPYCNQTTTCSVTNKTPVEPTITMQVLITCHVKL
jgi:uncharacterized Zn-finger protein